MTILLDQYRAGKRADSGFKKEAWIAVLAAVQAASSSLVISKKQVKSKVD